METRFSYQICVFAQLTYGNMKDVFFQLWFLDTTLWQGHSSTVNFPAQTITMRKYWLAVWTWITIISKSIKKENTQPVWHFIKGTQCQAGTMTGHWLVGPQRSTTPITSSRLVDYAHALNHPGKRERNLNFERDVWRGTSQYGITSAHLFFMCLAPGDHYRICLWV